MASTFPPTPATTAASRSPGRASSATTPDGSRVEPYYDTIKRYGDWESRDIWEYQLALDPDAVDLLLAHLWELRGVEFDYYFFDENCSYQILALIDAARPDLRLHEQFRGWVIPADTVRAVVAEPGLVEGTAFRPSAGTQLRAAARQLSRPERAPGKRHRRRPHRAGLRCGRVRSTAGRAPRVLGTAYELFRYRYLASRQATEEERGRARAYPAGAQRGAGRGLDVVSAADPGGTAGSGPSQQPRWRSAPAYATGTTTSRPASASATTI